MPDEEIRRRLQRLEEEQDALRDKVSAHDVLFSEARGVVNPLVEGLKQCVQKADFLPVQRVVYGIVGLILIGVITGLLGLVLKRP